MGTRLCGRMHGRLQKNDIKTAQNSWVNTLLNYIFTFLTATPIQSPLHSHTLLEFPTCYPSHINIIILMEVPVLVQTIFHICFNLPIIWFQLNDNTKKQNY